MSGSHDAERPSRSPYRASHKCKMGTEESWHILVCGSLPSHTIRSALIVGMPLIERNQYSNKESGKVNAGLEFGGSAIKGGAREESASTLVTNTSAVNIDFSQLNVPVVLPEQRLSIEELVQRLLHPPPHAFIYGILSIQWVRGAVDGDQFDFRESDERYVLSQDSELRKHGGELGMPAVYIEWLCGDSEEVSSTEQSVYLTPELFDEIRLEELCV